MQFPGIVQKKEPREFRHGHDKADFLFCRNLAQENLAWGIGERFYYYATLENNLIGAMQQCTRAFIRGDTEFILFRGVMGAISL